MVGRLNIPLATRLQVVRNEENLPREILSGFRLFGYPCVLAHLEGAERLSVPGREQACI